MLRRTPLILNKDVPVQYALIGDAKLTMEALIPEIRGMLEWSSKARYCEQGS